MRTLRLMLATPIAFLGLFLLLIASLISEDAGEEIAKHLKDD